MTILSLTFYSYFFLFSMSFKISFTSGFSAKILSFSKNLAIGPIVPKIWLVMMSGMRSNADIGSKQIGQFLLLLLSLARWVRMHKEQKLWPPEMKNEKLIWNWILNKTEKASSLKARAWGFWTKIWFKIILN